MSAHNCAWASLSLSPPYLLFVVVPALVPGIHVFIVHAENQDVDGRDMARP
jgi:hypothetical protein